MALTLIAGPLMEPVTLAQAKAHLRVDTMEEDILISSLILTSRLHIEAALGLALITQTWQLTLNDWPKGNAIPLPLHPVSAVVAVRTIDAGGTVTTLAPSAAILDQGPPARVVNTSQLWPSVPAAANGIAVTFTAGFGPAAEDVPQPVRQALLLLVAHWYEHRDPVEIGEPQTAIPKAVSDLLMPYRRPRL